MLPRIILFGLLLVGIYSCKSIGINTEEVKGIDDVLRIFGGSCEYSKTSIASPDNGNEIKYVLEISGSEFIARHINQKELMASGVAYAFFRNLNDEQKKYTHVRTVLVSDDHEKQSYDFEIAELEEVHNRMPLAYKVADLIKKGRFDDLRSMISDSGYYSINKEALVSNMEKLQPEFGNVIEFLPLGYLISRVDGHWNLHIAGQLKRDKQSNSIGIDIDFDKNEDKVVKVDYTF